MRKVRDYLNGTTRKGRCGDCGHTSYAVRGCRCMAAYCPCHRMAFGHGATGCNGKPASHR